LIFISRKPEAKKFRKWVTSEVLPALHRTGTYTMPNVSVSEPKANDALLNQLASQLDLIHSLSTNFWDHTRECESRFRSLEQKAIAPKEEPKPKIKELTYTVSGWAKVQGIKSLDIQTSAKIGMMATHYSEGRYSIDQIHDVRFGHVNVYEQKPLAAAFDAVLGLV